MVSGTAMPVTPITEVPPKKARKRSGSGTPPEPPAVPSWQTPTAFPEYAAPILRKPRIRRSQFSKFGQDLALFIASNLSADAAIALQSLIRTGDKDAIKLWAQAVGLVKNDSGVTINLQQNNQNNITTANREVDSIVRMLDARDHTKAIEEAPLAVVLDDEGQEIESEEA